MSRKCINVYVPNLPVRTDRRESIEHQFADKPVFQLQLMTPVPDKKGYISLWRTFFSAVRREYEKGSDYFIFCEDDHMFTASYDEVKLFSQIAEAQAMESDLLMGGISWMRDVLQVRDDLFWVSAFNGMQFTIVFRRFFENILATEQSGYDHVTDHYLSTLTESMFVIYPFISVQKDFGYSDATPTNNKAGYVRSLFVSTSERLRILDKVRKYYNNLSV